MIRHGFTTLIIVMVLVIARLEPLGPIDDLSSRFVIMVHNLYHVLQTSVHHTREQFIILTHLYLLYSVNSPQHIFKRDHEVIRR